MLRRALGLFLLVNVVGVLLNLPAILAAVDGESLGENVGRWTIGVGTAAGDLAREIGAGAPTPDEIVAIQEEVRSGQLERPLDDDNVAALVEVWRALMAAGELVDAQEIADLLAEDGVDVTDLDGPLPATPTTAPTVNPTSGT